MASRSTTSPAPPSSTGSASKKYTPNIKTQKPISRRKLKKYATIKIKLHFFKHSFAKLVSPFQLRLSQLICGERMKEVFHLLCSLFKFLCANDFFDLTQKRETLLLFD